jgi:tetratricopeptide (TPR) repeat protein
LTRNQVFVSYSHKDRRWLEELKKHLKPLLHDHPMAVWEDTQLRAGELWMKEIESALASSKVAVLLVSANYLASDFIASLEMPRILAAAADNGLRVIWIPVSASAHLMTPIKDYHAACDPARPLDSINAARRNQLWVRIASIIAEDLDKPIPPVHPDSFTGTRPPTSAGQDRVFDAKLPRMGSADLFGRQAEIDLISHAWRSDGTRIVSIVAPGGVGKSALCKRWLADISVDDYLGAKRIYAWSFYSQGTTEKNVSADPFLQHALAWFGDPLEEGSPSAKGARLARAIKNADPTIIVLDGLEPLQFPSGAPGGSQGVLKDKGLQELLRSLAEGHKGLVLVTTRIPVADLSDLVGKSVREIRLGGLTAEAGADLLRSAGADGLEEELREVSQSFDGHSLALLLLGKYLRTRFDGQLQYVAGVDQLTKEPENGGHAKRVMSSYARWFQDAGSKAELELLRVMGLFDRPAPGDVIKAIRAQPPIAGLTETLSDLDDLGRKSAVRHLRDLGLLAPAGEAEPDTLDAHPLVREHFGDDLRENYPGPWQEGHRRLYTYLAKKTEEYPSNSIEMDQLYSAVNHACACGEQVKAFRELIYRRAWRMEGRRAEHFFATRKLGMASADFVALAQFFERQWTRLVSSLSFEDQLRVLTDAGARLRNLGRLPEAMECLSEVVRRILEEAGTQYAKEGAYAAATLSELQLVCGKLPEAGATAETAIASADSGNDPYLRMHARSSLADVMMQRGDNRRAAELFDAARKIEADEAPEVPFMYSQSCYRYGSYLISTGKEADLIQIAAAIPEWGQPFRGSLLSRAIDKLILGQAYLLRDVKSGKGPRDMAAELLDGAVLDLGESGYTDYLIRGLIARAELHRLRGRAGDHEAAKSDLGRAEYEARRGGMRLLEFDVRCGRLRLEVAAGWVRNVSGELKNLVRLAREMRYRRGEDVVECWNLRLSNSADAKAV